MRIMCMGIGNILYGDDGFGPAVIDKLRTLEGIEATLHCGGVEGFSLVYELEDYDVAIIIDAVLANGNPGQVVRLDDADYLHSELNIMSSAHDSGLASAIELITGLDMYTMPKKYIFYGVLADIQSLSTDHLSDTALNAVEIVSNLIKKEVERLQGV